MASYLITSSSRGAGLTIAAHLATLPSIEVDRVFACARGESTALKNLINSSAGKVTFIRMDTSSETSIKESVSEIGGILDGQGLDVLINCSARAYGKSEDLDDHLAGGVMSVHNVTRKFLPLLKAGELKKIVNIGPSAPTGSAEAAVYKTSKAALDALTLQYSLTYKEQGFKFLTMSAEELEHGNASEKVRERIANVEGEEERKVIKVRVEGWEQTGLVACH